MKNIQIFIKNFLSNSGGWVFASTITNKLILFVIKAFILLYLEKIILGKVTYALSIIAFFTPFVGFGSPSGLLRYGSIQKDKKVREDLINYSFTNGLIYSILICLALIPFLYFFAKNDYVIYGFLLIATFRIFSIYLNGHQSVQMRIKGKNKAYSIYDLIYSVFLLILTISGAKLFGATGYLMGLVTAPFFLFLGYCVLYGFPKFNFHWPLKAKASEFWSYSMFASFSQVVSQLVIFLDILLIGNILDDSAVAEYSAASLIPINVLVFPAIFMKTDFKQIAEHHLDRKYLANYYKNYFILFAILCTVGMLLSWFIGEWLFSFLGSEYNPFNLFIILMIGACFSMLFRVPLGNMIGAFGKTKYNTIFGVISLLIDLILNLIFIPKYGLIGAAWATTITLILSGFLNFGYFLWYLKNECN